MGSGNGRFLMGSMLVCVISFGAGAGSGGGRFDVEGFARDYGHSYPGDIDLAAYHLRWPEEVAEDVRERLMADLRNYHGVGLLSAVRYRVHVEDKTDFYGIPLFSDEERKTLKEEARREAAAFLAKYGIGKAEAGTDAQQVDIAVRARDVAGVEKAVWVETHLTVKRTLLDPASGRPIVATVWEERMTRVHNRKFQYGPYTQQHGDLVERIVHDAESLALLLAWSQYRSFVAMEAAIRLDGVGDLPEVLEEYVTQKRTGSDRSDSGSFGKEAGHG